MPSGVYRRTEKHKKNTSRIIKMWIKNNPESHRNICSEAGKIGGKATWEKNREAMIENCRRNGKNRDKEVLWAGRDRWMETHREEVLKNCSKAGKAANGKPLKEAWENNRETMIEHCRKNGKIGGYLGGKITACLTSKNPSIFRSLERTVRKFLDNSKIFYRANVYFKKWGKKREADIVIDKYNLIIECDGSAHEWGKIKENDKFKTKMFNAFGYKVLRLTGKEIKNNTF